MDKHDPRMHDCFQQSLKHIQGATMFFWPIAHPYHLPLNRNTCKGGRGDIVHPDPRPNNREHILMFCTRGADTCLLESLSNMSPSRLFWNTFPYDVTPPTLGRHGFRRASHHASFNATLGVAWWILLEDNPQRKGLLQCVGSCVKQNKKWRPECHATRTLSTHARVWTARSSKFEIQSVSVFGKQQSSQTTF